VLVAEKRIPANTSFSSALAAGMIKRAQRVRNDLPDTNISGQPNDDQLNNEFKQLVAAHDIVAGETLVAEDFVAQGESESGLSGELQTDQAKDKTNQLSAMTVTLDDTHAVGGFLTPGDTVNVMITMSLPNKKHFLGEGGVKFTSYILPNMKVLAVGGDTAQPSTASGSSQSTQSANDNRSRSLITFEVNARQAEQLVQAQAAGTLYLTLNPPSFKPGTFRDPGEVVEAINLFDKPLPNVDQALDQLSQK
jgi:Flp pilus assembly protein CpaB